MDTLLHVDGGRDTGIPDVCAIQERKQVQQGQPGDEPQVYLANERLVLHLHVSVDVNEEEEVL